MLNPSTWRPARLPKDMKPQLLVAVDTEEEFDWSKPHNRHSTGVQSIRTQERAHKVFEKYGLKPTYLCDYPVAHQEDGYKPLRALYESGACDIGTHLHPWVNPPHYEPVNDRADILHDQARYWGKLDDHYHQFPRAGENTLSLKLVVLLLKSIIERGRYKVANAPWEGFLA